MSFYFNNNYNTNYNTNRESQDYVYYPQFNPQITPQQLQEQIAREQQFNQELLLQQEMRRLQHEQEQKENEKQGRLQRPQPLTPTSTIVDSRMDRENRDGELLPPRRIRPIEKRSFRIFCISCPPCVWISCCAIWTVILILAIILGSIAYANINQCRKLNVDNISPSVMTYDPNIFSEVKIESFGNYLKGQVFVSQSNSTNSKNATVRIQVAGIGKQGATVQTLSSNSQYSITLTQSGFGSPFEFLAYLTLPPKCSDARVHIIFPQTSQSSNSNGNKDQTVTVATLRSITSNNMDVTLQQNEVPFYDQIFNVTTIKSNIIVENFTANSIMLSSNIGEISGTIGGIYSQLKAASFKGVIQLSVDLTSRLNSFAQYVKTQQQPKIEVETESGNVYLKFDSTFSGNFSATTDKGHIQPLNTQNINTQTDTQVSGTVPGNLNANLTVVTYKGDINLEF